MYQANIAAERSANPYLTVTWCGLALFAAAAIVLRFWAVQGLPLWLDESWTAVISASPSFADFRHQVWLDSNAPLYYTVMWLWPFESAAGLRIPSMAFSLFAPLAAVLWRPASLSRRSAAMWAVLLLLWVPSLYASTDARPYALLLLVCTLQTIAFVRLVEDPDTRRAALWVGLCALAILTHYYAAAPAAVEGLAYLWLYRWRAVRTWPALALLTPALAWLVYHLPRLLLYAEHSWYERVGLHDWPRMLLWPLGGGSGLVVICVVCLAVLFLRRPPREVAVAAACGWIACAMLVAAGLLRPMLVDRYLLPCAPAILLGLAACLHLTGYLPVAAVMLASAGPADALRRGLQDRAAFGLEDAVRHLPNARTVTWSIDNRTVGVFDRRQMELLLADAFARNGRTISARWGNLTAGDGLIWFYGPSSEIEAERIRREWICTTHRGNSSTLICSRRS